MKHGYMLEESIEFLMIQYDVPDERILILREDMARGKKLSYILDELSYPQSVVSRMQFAEYYGKVESMLLEIENYLLIEKNQKDKILKTIRYPAILTTMLIILLIIFNLLVIPQFQNIYTTSNIKMDVQVTILINILYYLPKVLVGLLITLIISICYIWYTFKYKPNIFLKIIPKIPLINTYYKYYFSYQYASEISLFLMSGFSVKTSLEEIIKKDYNFFFTVFSKKIEKELILGENFENAVKKVVYFDNNISKFIVHGIRNSMLDKELKLYSDIMLDSFIKLIDTRLKKVQPILFFLLAFVIMGLYLTILLPIFNMTSTLK
ncbi:competence type IV pilus assembly protein ComGB [Gemella sp. GH3]|uniref:competence type IV pilus assembly protein ComGB n=1 Tax=unclassified Gemella TaxID=2624949 RepID=UPI00351AF8FB